MTTPRKTAAGKPGSPVRKPLPSPTPPREITITVPECTVHVQRAE